ncbi:serine hydrolase domain-containing protein [Pseudoxanthomonas beigongshangi]
MRICVLRATALAIALSSACAWSQPEASHTEKNGASASARPGDIAARSARFDGIMQRHAIPGAQLIHSHDGVYDAYAYGVMSHRTSREVTDQTVFQAASLSKVVGAYITLRLVDQGSIDLDTPLWDYWHSNRTEDNAAARKITARMVLNHTTGLPNWQISPSNPAIDDTPLVSQFEPGKRFSYSGEGFYLLQRTLEHVTGLGWDALAQREVFARFDMPSSHYLTDPAFDARNAAGHEKDGSTRPDRVFAWENTAWTLVTNAHDYNHFIQSALYRGEGLEPSTRDMMFARSSDADDSSILSAADPFIDWGLGVAIQSANGRKLVWHWGDNPGFKALFMLDPGTGESIVLFTNSENGLETYREVLELFLGEGDYPAIDWARAQS